MSHFLGSLWKWNQEEDRIGSIARTQRIEYEGAIYHVTARGNERRDIFRDDADRERFLRVLHESVTGFEVRLHLYCLMTNHIHRAVETPRANLGRFMHRLQTAYTIYFNRRHAQSGHLMQGRYGAKLIEKDAYLLRLSRYVHLNPVFTVVMQSRPAAERILALRQYVWSSYGGYIGTVRSPDWLECGPILAIVEADSPKSRTAYRRFVEAVYKLVHPQPQFGGHGNRGPVSPVDRGRSELSGVLADKGASADQIKAKLTALRAAQLGAAQELTRARQNLRQILTLRQEATLVLNGLLD